MIVYKATNTTNGKVYVGLSKYDLEKRKKEHKILMSREDGAPFHEALKKYGWDAFHWEVIDTADSLEQLAQKEMDWIRKLRSNDPMFGYNATEGGAVSKNSSLRKAFVSTLRIDLADALDRLAEVTRINKSKLLDEAVTDLLEKYKQQGVIK